MTTIYENWPLVDQSYRKDCEIIVFLKPLAKYAKYIQHRLTALGLIVDLLFPKMHISIRSVVANISTRGCVYAILINSENEKDRTLTLYILHGDLQEHRNIAIENALNLLRENFNIYIRESAADPSRRGFLNKHPKRFQLIPNLLTKNKQEQCTSTY